MLLYVVSVLKPYGDFMQQVLVLSRLRGEKSKAWQIQMASLRTVAGKQWSYLTPQLHLTAVPSTISAANTATKLSPLGRRGM